MTVLPSDKSNWPKKLPGFPHILRMWDASESLCSARILPGEFYVSKHHEIITTVLGSCVSACIRDLDTGVGGMNHFMLPEAAGNRVDRWGGQDVLMTRYGVAAMESLINEILKTGARRNRLELKLFGGGKVLAMDHSNVGGRNIQFAREFAVQESLKIMAEDLGGDHPRKVHYFPRTGKVLVRRLRSLQNRVVIEQEKKYEKSFCNNQTTGSIELFD